MSCVYKVLDILAMLGGQAIVVSIVESYGGMEEVTAYVVAFHYTLPLTIGPFCASFWLLYLIKHKVPVSEGGLAPEGSVSNVVTNGSVEHVSVPNEEVELDVTPNVDNIESRTL